MKRLADRRQRRLRRVGFWAAVTAIGAYLLFVGDQRPHHLLLLWLEDRRTEERIDELEAEREELRVEARNLASDTLALEALARERGMIRPGDLVYRIVPVPPDVRQAAAESLAARAARLAADSLAAVREAEESRSREPDRPPTSAPPSEAGPREGAGPTDAGPGGDTGGTTDPAEAGPGAGPGTEAPAGGRDSPAGPPAPGPTG